jgi:hypothetical protein
VQFETHFPVSSRPCERLFDITRCRCCVAQPTFCCARQFEHFCKCLLRLAEFTVWFSLWAVWKLSGLSSFWFNIILIHITHAWSLKWWQRHLKYSSETSTFYQNELAVRDTADVTGGKPIDVWSQSISGGGAVNPLVAFYDIHGRKEEVSQQESCSY